MVTLHDIERVLLAALVRETKLAADAEVESSQVWFDLGSGIIGDLEELRLALNPLCVYLGSVNVEFLDTNVEFFLLKEAELDRVGQLVLDELNK